MAFLNLASEPIQLTAVSDPQQSKTEVTIQMAEKEINQLKVGLTDLLLQAAQLDAHAELKVSFPQGWTIFWKVKGLESRFLLAHPDEQIWVATLTLTVEFCEKLVQNLETDRRVSEVIDLSSLCSVSKTSNLNVKLIKSIGK